MQNNPLQTELHPLPPFLPDGARLLMLGSFPPPRRRWSMEFFYPNPQNDMWRIVGYLFVGDKHHFLADDRRRFDRERIVCFCRKQGLALYDAAVEVVRLKENASDNFLQVVREVDLAAVLERIPACRTIAVTGQKSAEVVCAITGAALPPVGGSVDVVFAGREMTLWRMPSSSRAYPRSVEWKAEFYRNLFLATGML